MCPKDFVKGGFIWILLLYRVENKEVLSGVLTASLKVVITLLTIRARSNTEQHFKEGNSVSQTDVKFILKSMKIRATEQYVS